MFIFAISCATLGVVFLFPAATAVFADNRRKYAIITMTFTPLLAACLAFMAYETSSAKSIFLKLTFAAVALLVVCWLVSFALSLRGKENRRFKPPEGGRVWIAEIVLCTLSTCSLLLPFSVTPDSNLTGIESVFALYNEGIIPFLLMLHLVAAPLALIIICAVCRRGNAPYIFGVLMSALSSLCLASLGSFLGYFNQFGAAALSVVWLGIALFSLLGAPVEKVGKND